MTILGCAAIRGKRPRPLTVRLPGRFSVPEAYWDKPYVVRELLADGESNTKLRKSNVSSYIHGYRTYGLSLAPADESGYQMCASSSYGCRRACLYKQGRGQCDSTILSRIAKTIAFHEHRDWFEERLRWELASAIRRSQAAGLTPAFRLNVVSDVMWEKVFPWIFELPLQGYDYSKHLKRMLSWCRGQLPETYHLTFSRSECNERDSLKVLKAGGNVAVVFRGPPLPKTWRGYEVISGEEDDMRFLDPNNVVVGLTAKGSARHDDTGFVVDTNRYSLPLISY